VTCERASASGVGHFSTRTRVHRCHCFVFGQSGRAKEGGQKDGWTVGPLEDLSMTDTPRFSDIRGDVASSFNSARKNIQSATERWDKRVRLPTVVYRIHCIL
jgi:hypothetical protein